jgi:hypothetical protein
MTRPLASLSTVASGSYWFRAGLPEEFLQVTTCKQFQYNKAWMLLKADPNEVYDIWMVELAHD